MLTVCMATYNGERFIWKQINSILRQLDEKDELIISDDGSTDKTKEIISSFSDPRIKIIDNEGNKSPAFNFENALAHAQGDTIYLADQDDIWKDNKIETVQAHIGNCDLLISDADIIDEFDHIIAKSFYEINSSRSGLWQNFYRNSFLGCTMTINRKILDLATPFPKDIPMHDWWLGLVAELSGKTLFISDKLISYRRHSQNASSTSSHSILSLNAKIRMRIGLAQNLARLAIKNKPS